MRQWFIALLAMAGIMLLASSAWAEMLSVKVPTANFREGPGGKHAILFTADRYYPVEVLERTSGWVKAKDFEGEVAWVASRLLAKRRTVVVSVRRANVRDEPSRKGKILFKADRSDAFKVKSQKGVWLEVEDPGGRTGWVHSNIVWGMTKPSSKGKETKDTD